MVAACSGQYNSGYVVPSLINTHGDDAGEQTNGCLKDSDCGATEVCVNCGGTGECTPGCRDDSQCLDPHNICQLGTVCQSCPCPPGWCILDPCRDEDADGYAAATDPGIVCPIPTGDCDDLNPAVHPNAPELCTNYIDDNCDGITDEHDPACVCPMAEARCFSAFECGDIGVNACDKVCCTTCNGGVQKPDCSTEVGGTYCAQPFGTNPVDGCNYGWSCDDCGSCSSDLNPVCSQNGSTYDNACLLGQANAVTLHDGACLPGEGILCLDSEGADSLDGGCDPGGTMYCRNACADGSSCESATCTKKGVCVLDTDCPAGLPAPTPKTCTVGSPTLACINSACVSVCR